MTGLSSGEVVRLGRWSFSNFKSVSCPLFARFSLSLVLMQQTGFVFSHIVNIDSTCPKSYLPWAVFITVAKNVRCDWLLIVDQPMKRFVAHTVVRSRKVVQGCRVGCLQAHFFESSCWLYNFPTFTCARCGTACTDLHHSVWSRPW